MLTIGRKWDANCSFFFYASNHPSGPPPLETCRGGITTSAIICAPQDVASQENINKGLF